jgi:hypothetical protein
MKKYSQIAFMTAAFMTVLFFSGGCAVETDEDFSGEITGAQTANGMTAPKEVEARRASYSYGNNSQIVVSWETVDGATGYNIYVASSAKGVYKKESGPATSSPADIESLKSGQTYYIKVTAVFPAGESPFSASASAEAR